MTEPKLFTKNYITSDDVFSAVYFDTSNNLLVDRSRYSQWNSNGANSDGTEISIQITFMEGASAATRVLDGIWVLNHNFKEWSVQVYTDSAWVDVFTSTTDTTTDKFISLASVSATMMKIKAKKTQVANQEKKIGLAIAAGLSLNVGCDMNNYDVRYREKIKDIVLGDGTLHRVWTRFGVDGYATQKYEATVSFKFVPKATRDALRLLKESGAVMVWQPESVERPEEAHEVLWVSPWAEKYSSLYKNSGYDISFQLRSV
jgi:hypothetical protein